MKNIILKVRVLLFILSAVIISHHSFAQQKDVFGIDHIMPSKLPVVEWNSQHWSSGGSRNLRQNQIDPQDPTGWSRPRGDLNLFNITGNGVLRMGGTEPRLYIQSTAQRPVFFRDTEFTGYFKRSGSDGPFNGGFVIGVRSGAEGHGTDVCNANTYYFGFRNPGNWVFYKELAHPLGANGASGRIFPNNEIMPADKWFGVKFIVYNIPGTNHVKLIAYVDLESNGDTSKKITWKKVAELTDDGNWTVPVGDCTYPGNKIITTGGGAVLVRNSGVIEAQYKMLSVREIDPLRNDDPLDGTGDGLSGNYFNGMNFETSVFNRKDATLNMNWGDSSPNAAVANDRFSARWTGQIQPKYSGEYTFYMTSDNGRRVWVNNQLIIDQWKDDWDIAYSGKINLVANQKYDIKVEYFENVGGANVKLEWSSAQQTRQVVPALQLYSNPLPTVSISSNTANVNGPANITLNATAADANGISKVDFYNGTTLLGTDNTSPYSYAWNNVAVGTYTVKVLATDTKGGVTLSTAITIKVNPVVVNPNVAPTVSLTSPSNNANFNAPASLSIAANASDMDGSVSKVEFYNGAQKLGEDASAPYTYTWTNVAAGNYILTAKAYDNLGAVTASTSVVVKVNTVVSDQCSGIAAYAENGGYVVGSKVKNVSKRYECKEFPYSGWCNGAAWAYAPGTGAYWTDAWYDRGSCTARQEEEWSTSEVLLIAPNPVSDVLSIHLNQTSLVTICNSQGMEVLSATRVESKDRLQLGHLPSGIYFVKIDTGTTIIVETVIKN